MKTVLCKFPVDDLRHYPSLIPDAVGVVSRQMQDVAQRLDELEEAVRELTLKAPSMMDKQPAPAPAPLVKACSEYLNWIDSGDAYATEYKLQGHHNDTMRQSLAAEVKRQEAVEKVIEAARNCKGIFGTGHPLPVSIAALDALDGGGR